MGERNIRDLDVKPDNIKTVENFVLRSFKKVNNEKRLKFFNRTLYWTDVLRPNASDALKIAALSYDIEDAFKMANPFHGNIMRPTKESIEYHQKQGAKIMKKFLSENGFPDKVTSKVYDIIAEHETGNGEDHIILRDADRISYFENVAIRRARTGGMIPPERIKDEFNRMISDISTDKAREIIVPFHKKALNELNRK